MYSTPAPPPVRRPVPSTGYHILRPVSLALPGALSCIPFPCPYLEERCCSRFWRPVHLQVAGQLCACSAPLVQNDLVDQLLPLPPVRCEREAQSWPYVK